MKKASKAFLRAMEKVMPASKDNKAEKNRQYYKANRKRILAQRLVERAADPRIPRAQSQVQKAIRSGLLMPGPCASCGALDHIEAHHVDYDRPLLVVWLCSSCHGLLHKQMGG